jgi:hypothetical protein
LVKGENFRIEEGCLHDGRQVADVRGHLLHIRLEIRRQRKVKSRGI